MKKRSVLIFVLTFVIATFVPENIYADSGLLLVGENESFETNKCLHEDINGNHYCDYCTFLMSDHEDIDKNHYCDICGVLLSNHVDDNKNHYCDICGVLLSNHVDENMNHYCDFCGIALSSHEDSNNNGYCDYCGLVMEDLGYCQHQDVDCDHYCDYCKQMISNHKAITVQGGVAATYDAAGYRDCYMCECGLFFEDPECTIEISDIKKWKSEGGNGYLPKLQKMKKYDVVETGDDTDILFLSIIMLISALCCGVCIVYRQLINKKG